MSGEDAVAVADHRDANPGELRVHQIVEVGRTGYERLVEGADSATYADILAQLGPGGAYSDAEVIGMED